MSSLSTPKNDAARALNIAHAAAPKVGDYWSEMFNGICLVIQVGQFHVSLLKAKNEDRYGWTFDTSKVSTMTRPEFNKWLSYGSIPGTWAMVTPDWKHAQDFIDEALAKATP